MLRRLPRRFIIASAAASLAFLLLVHVLTLDGLDGLFFEAITPDDTQFVSGYSALGFWRVQEGMTVEQVRQLVGAPLERYPIANDTGWRWTRSPHDSNYRIRAVLFVNGRVSEKLSEYYID
jgi:hypothetical protein